jgi:acyl-CoA reductase-like NAD-dependent aldehyde dehydrogenase
LFGFACHAGRLEVTTSMLKDGKLLKDRGYVAGEWIGGAAISPITNPVDDSVIGHVPKLGATETRNAIEAAASMAVAREETIRAGRGALSVHDRARGN